MGVINKQRHVTSLFFSFWFVARGMFEKASGHNPPLALIGMFHVICAYKIVMTVSTWRVYTRLVQTV